MRINIKNLKGEVFAVEAEPTQTVTTPLNSDFQPERKTVLPKRPTCWYPKDHLQGQDDQQRWNTRATLYERNRFPCFDDSDPGTNRLIQKPQPKAQASENIKTSQKVIEKKEVEV